jgi:phage shock protein C
MEDRLYRSRDDRVIAGVAGGLAERWDADPSIVRLVWALLVVFTGGIALLVYVIMAFIVPEEGVRSAAPTAWTGAPGTTATPTPPPPGYSPPPSYGPYPTRAQARAERRAARRARRGDRDGQVVAAVVGLVLLLLGSFFLVREWIPQLDFDWFWPVILIGIGVAMVVGTLSRRPEPSDPAFIPAGPPPATPAQPAPAVAPPVQPAPSAAPDESSQPGPPAEPRTM